MKKTSSLEHNEVLRDARKMKRYILDKKKINQDSKVYLEGDQFESDVNELLDSFFGDTPFNQDAAENIISHLESKPFFRSKLYQMICCLQSGIQSYQVKMEEDLKERVKMLMTTADVEKEANVTRAYINQETYDLLDDTIPIEVKEGKMPAYKHDKFTIIFRDVFERWNNRRKRK